jgi:hypothetical protein
MRGPASTEEDNEEEEMPKEDSPDEVSAFHVDRSTHDRCTERLQELCEEAEADVTAIQRGADERGIVVIGSEYITQYGR